MAEIQTFWIERLHRGKYVKDFSYICISKSGHIRMESN